MWDLFLNMSASCFCRTEVGTLGVEDKELFTKFSTVLARELLPYLNKCLQALFPSKSIEVLPGVGTLGVDSSNPICVNIDELTKPLLPMLPSETINSAPETTAPNDHSQNHVYSIAKNQSHQNNKVLVKKQDTDPENILEATATKESQLHDQNKKEELLTRGGRPRLPETNDKLVLGHSGDPSASVTS